MSVRPPHRQTVLVGMSGGVDSSVAAALLVKQGYSVIGGFIKNWSDTKDVWTGECEWRGDRRDAMRVAAKLGIPLLTFDFEDAYRRDVVDTLFQGYAEGTTPNPDVLCNQFIKFGLFFEEMKRLNADFIATGHYARVRHGKDRSRLLRGKDAEKDQSYFLHRVTQEALHRTLFPVGDLQKPQVRAIARELGLSTAAKKESMGICFIGKQDMNAFLRTRIPSRPGEVVDVDGVVLGHHEGLDSVTIGQRHGFTVDAKNTPNANPWYAAAKQGDTNRLVVVPGRTHPLLYRRDMTVGDVHWVKGSAPRLRVGIRAMVRHRQAAVPCRITMEAGKVSVHFSTPVFAVAPGQSCVFYRGSTCLGGGIIEKV